MVHLINYDPNNPFSDSFSEFLNEKNSGVYTCFSGINLEILLWFVNSKYKNILKEFQTTENTYLYFFKSKIRSRKTSVSNNIYLRAKNTKNNDILFELVEKKIHKESQDTTHTFVLWSGDHKIVQTNKFLEMKKVVEQKNIQTLLRQILNKILPDEIVKSIFVFIFLYDSEKLRVLPLT